MRLCVLNNRGKMRHNKRDVKGRFIPSGEKKKPKLRFKEKFISKAVHKDMLKDAFLDGFKIAERGKGKLSAGQCLQEYLKRLQ